MTRTHNRPDSKLKTEINYRYTAAETFTRSPKITRKGKEIELSYYQAPEESLEDNEEKRKLLNTGILLKRLFLNLKLRVTTVN